MKTATKKNETQINYDDAPPLESVIDSSGAVNASSWTEVDVTPFVKGNGVFSLALTLKSGEVIRFASRESGSNAPQLIIESNATGPTPTRTPTSASGTPTRTPTSAPGTPTRTPTSAPGTPMRTPTSPPARARSGPRFAHNAATPLCSPARAPLRRRRQQVHQHKHRLLPTLLFLS